MPPGALHKGKVMSAQIGLFAIGLAGAIAGVVFGVSAWLSWVVP